MTGAIEVKCASEANSNSYLLSARKGLRARKVSSPLMLISSASAGGNGEGNDYITLYRV